VEKCVSIFANEFPFDFRAKGKENATNSVSKVVKTSCPMLWKLFRATSKFKKTRKKNLPFPDKLYKDQESSF
jgi:hypothetical protein